MKKAIIFSILLAIASFSAMGQQKESKVQHLTYQEFIKKVWDFEKNPSNFVFNGKTPAIVDFYADWCGPCRRVAPILEKLAEEYDGRLSVYKINVDQEKELASAFQVRSIPMMLFIPMEGQPLMQVGALDEAQLRNVVTTHLVK